MTAPPAVDVNLGPIVGQPGTFTVEQAAAWLQLSKAAVYRLIENGRLPAKRFGRCLRIPRSVLEGFLASEAGTIDEYLSGPSTLDSSTQVD